LGNATVSENKAQQVKKIGKGNTKGWPNQTGAFVLGGVGAVRTLKPGNEWDSLGANIPRKGGKRLRLGSTGLGGVTTNGSQIKWEKKRETGERGGG